MPNWSQILDLVEASSNPSQVLLEERRKYMDKIQKITGRNIIAYYSGWLKKADAPHVSIEEQDKNAFMNAVYKLDRRKGLDLILHTPGGDIAATESLVTYLHDMFKGDIRAFVPQISMSAGTMIAMSCKEIIMGSQSALGPIDPQLGGVACQSVKDEFDKAVEDIRKRPTSLGLWQVIVSKYTPTFLTECENAVKWSEELVRKWLREANENIDANQVIKVFLNHKNTYSHNRHISREDCIKAGLINVKQLEADQELQDALLSLHHCYMILLDKFLIAKVVENSIGSCFFQTYSEKVIS